MPTGTEQALQVLQGLDEVERELGTLSILFNDRKKITSKIDARIARLTAFKDDKTTDIDSKIRQKELNIFQYVERNMDEFRDGKKKSRKFATGKIATKDVVNYDYPDEDELIDLLEANNFANFVKVKKTPLKNLIKAAIAKDESVAELLNIDLDNDIDISIKLN